MTEFYFDMRRIGQTIVRLRREQNLTQMALADLMGVSFQAVSNWERGQSMPDVSKLPELADIFSVSVDELLGRQPPPIVTHAMKDDLEEYLQSAPVSLPEAVQVAPVLLPGHMEQITDQLLGLRELLPLTDLACDETCAPAPAAEIPADIHAPELVDLLPYLSTEKVDALLRSNAADEAFVSACLPFASSRMLTELADTWEHKGRDIQPLVPFLPSDKVERIAAARMEAGQSWHSLAPFLCTSTVDAIASTMEARGESISALAPFMSSGALERIFLDRLRQGKPVRPLLPFVSSDLLSRLADAAAKASE